MGDLAWDASIDECDNIGNTPGNLLPRFLVSTGISPTHVLGARNDQGETPKDLAQQFYKDAIIEYINGIEWERDHPEQAEKMGANMTITNQSGETPRDIHSSEESKRKQKVGNTFSGDLEHLASLIEKGVSNINEQDEKGSTAAHKG
ncbi:hypothetical protein DPMN_086406 [Dreissena polymorpha]|uniref:Uncharacterized protein n=1 Tax=Dreissena polymorpha TaxID=45954 RepID=A0A9D4KRT6_DREPO|nr:hypothetical protein DPMN_086406 [Dreissena polymorpha]